MRRLMLMVTMTMACLVPVGCDDPGKVVSDFIASDTTPAPSDLARDLFRVDSPDKRRRALNLLTDADWGGEPPYLRAYRLLGAEDPDPTVRAAALRALGKFGSVDDVAMIKASLKDANKVVRWEAAVALQRIHREDAAEALIQAMRDDTDTDVKTACANALGQYAKPEVFQSLVGALSDRDYTVATEAAKSLNTLTGQDFGTDGSKWLAFADKNEKLFEGQKNYFYPQYRRDRTMMEKAMFWKKAPKPLVETQPTGLNTAEAAKPGLENIK